MNNENRWTVGGWLMNPDGEFALRDRRSDNGLRIDGLRIVENKSRKRWDIVKDRSEVVAQGFKTRTEAKEAIESLKQTATHQDWFLYKMPPPRHELR